MPPRRLLHEQLAEDGVIVYQIPERWQDDPNIKQMWYFTVPNKLLDCVVRAVGEKRMWSDLVQREREIAQGVDGASEIVAIRQGEFISYPYLQPHQSLRLGEFEARHFGKTLAEVHQIAKCAEERLQAFGGPLRGYVGWLLTNPEFLYEHDHLHLEHRDLLQTHQYPLPLLSRPRPDVVSLASEEAWVRDWQEFYSRWRLRSMAAPYLPVPIAPLVPDCWTLRSTDTPEGMITVTIPDISPTLGRGVVDETLEDALRGGNIPAHLKAWMQIVGKRNTAKNVIPSHERRFRLQHYWRVLHRLYPQALHRKKRALTAAFASFLDVSEDTVRNDLNRIARNLGSQWAQRWVVLD